MSGTGDERLARARAVAAGVEDPELPALTIADLGILRDVTLRDGTLEVTITPTYTGCPATAVIGWEIEAALERAGLGPARVRTVLAPAWSSAALTAAAGAAPPACPRCASPRTELLSAFGATACKSLHRCLACREPFEAFKFI